VAQKSDQYNVRYTMLDVQLKEKGIRWTVHRRKGLHRTWTHQFGKIMAMIADLVHKRSVVASAENLD
jgi:hypothetical protein